MAETVHIKELAEHFLGKAPSTLYRTWRARVRDGRLPPVLPGDKPEWPRAQVEAFFAGEARPERPQAAKRGRKPGPSARPSSLPLMQG